MTDDAKLEAVRRFLFWNAKMAEQVLQDLCRLYPSLQRCELLSLYERDQARLGALPIIRSRLRQLV